MGEKKASTPKAAFNFMKKSGKIMCLSVLLPFQNEELVTNERKAARIPQSGSPRALVLVVSGESQ